MRLTTAQMDRACGVLLATAAGDALGAPYEFQPPRGPEKEVTLCATSVWQKGEWTDDTSMAIAIAEVAAAGADLGSQESQDAIVTRWYEWSRTAKDVGNQTRNVLAGVGAQGASAAKALAASRRLHEQTGHTAGNGSLMRTAPVALAYIDDQDGLAEVARTISELTHFDPDAGDACVLWCLAIRHAVLTGECDVRVGMDYLDAQRRRTWAERLDAAESGRPADFENNGWVVAALQAAWSAITNTRGAEPPAEHLARALDAAVRAGYDTDTVAAIAGGLLGAQHGASAVPAAWRRLLHGWPGLRSRDLVRLAGDIARGGSPAPAPDYRGWSGAERLARHPYDDGLWIGGVEALRELPDGVDAVVSLCRVADDDIPAGVEQIDVRLIDEPGAEENPNLDFVLTDTARLLDDLRAEGRTVLLHCVAAHSRTPTLAALYGARVRGVSVRAALTDVLAVLPDASPNSGFRAALNRLAP